MVTVQAPDAEPVNRLAGSGPRSLTGAVYLSAVYGQLEAGAYPPLATANRNGQPVEMWLGISLDEVPRMKHQTCNASQPMAADRAAHDPQRLRPLAGAPRIQPTEIGLHILPYHNKPPGTT